MRLNPVLAELGTYPFLRLTEAAERVAARGVELIDFGMGEPREPVPDLLREALVAAVREEAVSTYPRAVGLPELREAAAGWVARRFGARLDPDTEVLPTLASKEAIFHLAQVVGAPGDAVAVTTPGYPVAGRAARFSGLEPVGVPLDGAAGWLPDLDRVPWDRLALLWLNTPNNPTGAVAPLDFLEEAAARCRRHGAVLASDEAYSELWFGAQAPASALQVADRTGVIALHTLSKRSSVPGYRSGFAAGDPELVRAYARHRAQVGTTPPAVVQRASVAAWGDEAHVDAVRARYARKREIVRPALLAAGLHDAGGDATFFLWMRVADGDDEGFAARWLERGLVLTPGSFLGPGGEGHVRVALVPTVEACERAAAILEAG